MSASAATARILYSPVLAPRRTVDIDEDSQAVTFRPVNRREKVVILSSRVWLSPARLDRPVSDAQTDMVQTGSGYCCKVGFGDPGIPVSLQTSGGSLRTVLLSVSEFIDDGGVTGGLEDGRSDPGLDYKKAKSRSVRRITLKDMVDDQHLRTSHPPRLTALIFWVA